MTNDECLDILDLPKDATMEDIAKAYRQLVLVWHPDRFSDPDLKTKAQARLAKINLAYEYLTSGMENDSKSQGAPTSANPAYEDNTIRYLRGDPRLQAIGEQAAVLELRREGILLFVHGGGDARESILYPWDLFQFADTSSLRYCRIGEKYTHETPLVNSGEVFLNFRDPEEIVRSITVGLRCRNGYFLELLIKRINELCPIQKTDKPNQPFEVPDWISIAVIAGFVAFIVLVALMAK